MIMREREREREEKKIIGIQGVNRNGQSSQK